ncbi:MAG: response regulator [Flavobacteriales bacterium]
MSKILIIEDETIISFGYRLQLERMGFEVIGTARSSAEAEELLRNERPDLIIMDIYLKGEKNGLELAQEIHGSDPITIIFLTASTKPEIIGTIRGLKGCHYLPKPINSDSLEDMLQRFARGEN